MNLHTGDASARLAAFVADTRWEDVPAPVRHEAKRSLLNYFACALGGCRDAAVEAASRALKDFGGEASATVIGRAEKRDALSAAFLNAGSANVFDFDDTHTPTIIHPTAPVAPALFALAETTHVRGRDLLLALIVGVEAECRIGNAVSPQHYRRGWHITSTCGVFGAAAGAARLLGLDTERVVWALGNASAQAGGLLETLGSMAKSISVGNAARNGLAAAFFARAGLSGPPRPLEGPYGFLRVTTDDAKPERIAEGLGASWEIAANTYKLYPAGIVLSPVIEACLALVNEERVEPGEIERIEIVGHPLLRERTDRVHPASGREAQVSAQHAVAVALTRGEAGLPEFTDACARDGSLRALREKVSFVEDGGYAVEAAALELRLRGGRRRVMRVDCARGSAARPLTDGDLEHKLAALIEFGGSSCDARALSDAVWSLEDCEDAGAIMRLAAGRG